MTAELDYIASAELGYDVTDEEEREPRSIVGYLVVLCLCLSTAIVVETAYQVFPHWRGALELGLFLLGCWSALRLLAGERQAKQVRGKA
jgi:hypothetical protein